MLVHGGRRAHQRSGLLAYLYLLPALVPLFIFHIWPLALAVYLSLHKWELTNLGFVGLENYRKLLTEPDFWRSLKVTFYYMLMIVPTELAIGLGTALLLWRVSRGRAVYRLIYFLPFIIPVATVGLVWSQLYNPTSGPVNYLLRMLGLPTYEWLQEPAGIFGALWGSSTGYGPSLALLAVATVTIWFYVGFHTVVYLSGLNQIPTEVLEAARVDGAAQLTIFRRILWPLLSPTTLFLVVIATIGSFQSFVFIYVINSSGYVQGGDLGAPLGTTKVASLYMFEQFYRLVKMGYASGVAVFLFLVIGLVTMVLYRILSSRVHYLN